MKVIVIKNDKNLGKAGTVTNVADGHAVNFLFPQGIAMPATKDTMRQIDAMKAKKEQAYQEHAKNAQAVAKTIGGKKIRIEAKAKGTTLFGSVGAKEIAHAINDSFQTQIEAADIKIAEPIKEITTREVEIDMGFDVTASVIIDVVAG